MKVLPEFVDMAKNPAEMAEEAKPFEEQEHPVPVYSYRQAISFNQEDLDKLSMDTNVDPGDLIHLQAIGKVTAVSKTDTDKGCECRVEVQLTHIRTEAEHDDVEEVPVRKKMDRSQFYD